MRKAIMVLMTFVAVTSFGSPAQATPEPPPLCLPHPWC